MKRLRWLLSTALLISAGVSQTSMAANGPYWQPKDSKDQETYVKVPLPAGFQVIETELEGPVFATAEGKTLYQWQLGNLRNGNAGDRRNSGEATCDDTIYKETSGYMSPYPPGFLLPELDQRKSCEQLWPPVLAPKDTKPIGKWTVVKRKNGDSQWAFDGYPVYTSVMDRKAGDVYGGTNALSGGAQGIVRVPIGPPPDAPPELSIVPFRTGHMITTYKGFSVYASDADEAGKSNCTGKCLSDWDPVIAPQTAKPKGEWSVVERSPGIKQWAYRSQPLYTYVHEKKARAVTGSDIPGWRNVFTQRALPPPAQFTVQDSRIGQVLADKEGKTIYLYQCNDDALDQQTCDHPDSPQAYRMAICGNFDAKVCQQTFPYVKAEAGAKSDSSLWTVVTIDPNTGKWAKQGDAGAMQVWAYRGRPVYTYGDDLKPGDANGDNYGEFNGQRNGFRAFWLRDDYRNNNMGRMANDR